MGAYGPSSVTPHKNVLLPIEDWNADVLYTDLSLVTWQDGFWRATIENTNSEPVSGNTDWDLVAGTLSVDITLTPAEITDLHNTPVSAIPAPGSGFFIFLLQNYAQYTPGSTAYDLGGGNGRIRVMYGTTEWQRFTSLGLDTLTDTIEIGSVTQALLRAVVENVAVTLASATDFSGGSPPGDGIVLVHLRYTIVPLNPVVSPFFSIAGANVAAHRFFVVGDATAMTAFDVTGSTTNDGSYTVASTALLALEADAITGAAHLTKTITIAGDHAAAYPAGSKASITGSTGNDGTYTVVSATFTVSTAIVVAEALPDATDTADGTIGHAAETIVTVTGAIASSTGDGWIEI